MAVPPDGRTFDSYILCATPRTGSTLLCDLLTATGVAGAPDSFFMPDPDPVWAQAWGLPDPSGMDDAAHAAACLSAAIRAGRGSTPIFGLRLMQAHLAGLMTLIDRVHPGLPSDLARIRAAFGHTLFLHLSRDDKLAQAVSMVKAEQTGLWHAAPDSTEIERLAPPQPPAYDFARIDRKLAELERRDAEWPVWFAAQGIAPLRLRYEDLSADPSGTVARICAALGLPAPDPAGLSPTVGRLADAVSQDWMHRYRQDRQAGGPDPA